ncbi:MAG: hypothetical protein OEY11_03065 [Gammaproteobacteria bacterium]|nr:hypothetical protein [Gammaproteobacteria bacterium]
MKQAYLKSRCSRLILTIGICLISSLTYADNFLIVSNLHHGYHRDLADNIQTKLLLDKHVVSNVSTDEFKPEALDQYDSVITVGYKAAFLLFNKKTRTPVLSLLIPRQAFMQLESTVDKQYRHLFSVIYIDQPIIRQLQLIRNLSNSFKTVGILFGKNSHERKNKITEKIKQAGLAAKSITVFNRTELISETRFLSEESDILLAVPDSSIYNKRSIKGILLTTYRKKIPVLGYSKAYVRAGALAAVHSSPLDISRQALEILNKNRVSNYASASRSFPQYFNIEINTKVAHSLNIKIADKNTILNNMLEDRKNGQL